MYDSSNSVTTQKVAIGGMTCANCEILVERRLKDSPGVERVRVDHARGLAEIEHRGRIGHRGAAACGRGGRLPRFAMGRRAGRKPGKPRPATMPRSRVCSSFCRRRLRTPAFRPRAARFRVSDTMSLGLVLLIGLVASVSSCMAVTGGLLVAAAPPTTSARPVSAAPTLKPHLYFNAGRHRLLHLSWAARSARWVRR